MENDKHNALIDELVQGMEKANQLKFHLNSASLTEAQELLLQRTIHSYEKALMILRWDGLDQRQARVAEAGAGPPASVVAQQGSSMKLDGSPGSDEDYSRPKKRKLHQPTWTQQVRVNSGDGLEGPTDDGYSWRKYGQKDILGAKYPRSYYRCTYRALRNCWATKQVQRSDEDRSVFEITYKGSHTCTTVQHATALSEEKGATYEYVSSYNHQPPQEQNQNLMNLKSKNLRVSTENIAHSEGIPSQFSFPCHDSYFPMFSGVDDENNYVGAYNDVFLSPAASGSNYFSSGAYRMNGFEGVVNFKQRENSDIAEVVSGHASTSNSPICGIDFASETSQLNPNIRF